MSPRGFAFSAPLAGSAIGLGVLALLLASGSQSLALSPARTVEAGSLLVPVQGSDEEAAKGGRGPADSGATAPFEELNAALAAARAKLEELAGAAEIASRASELRRQLEAARQENVRLGAELEELRGALEAAEAGLDRAKSEIADRTETIATLEADSEARVEEAEQSRAEAERLRQALAAKEEQLAEAENARRDAEARLIDMREELGAALAEATQLREQAKGLDDRLSSAGAALARVQRERDAARAEAAALREDKATLEARLTDAQAEAERLGARTETMAQRLARLEKAAGSAADAARANLTAMEDKIALLNAALADVQPSAAPAAAPRDADRDAAGEAGANGSTASGETPPVPPAATAASAREQVAALDTLFEQGPAATPAAELEALKAGQRSTATPRSLAELTAALPLEERMQAQGLLTDLEAETTEQGLLVTIPGEALFALDSESIESTAHEALTKVADVVDIYDRHEVLITGHTDAMGDSSYNEALSKRRADLVKTFFVDQFGIEPDRLLTRGLGESRPIASNATLAGRQANRRIEVLVLN